MSHDTTAKQEETELTTFVHDHQGNSKYPKNSTHNSHGTTFHVLNTSFTHPDDVIRYQNDPAI